MSALQPDLLLHLHQARGLAEPWFTPAPLAPRRAQTRAGAHRLARPACAAGQPSWSPVPLRPWRGAMRDLTLGLAIAMLLVEAILAFAGA